MLKSAIYKKVLLVIIFPLLANCGHSLYQAGNGSDGDVIKLCTLRASVPHLSIQINKEYSQDSKLAFLVSNSGGELLFDECSANENRLARSLPFSSPYSLSRNQSSSNIFISYSEFYNFYFNDGLISLPTSSDIGIEVYMRNSCDEELELVDTFNRKINWEQQFPNGEDCGGSSFFGNVQIQGND